MYISASLIYLVTCQNFVYSSHPDGGIASPAIRLIAKNTHRVFFVARPCPPGTIYCRVVLTILRSAKIGYFFQLTASPCPLPQALCSILKDNTTAYCLLLLPLLSHALSLPHHTHTHDTAPAGCHAQQNNPECQDA